MNRIVCNTEDFSEKSEKICENIYRETAFLIRRTSANPEFKDILMEQIFLCAVSGFGDFINNTWIKEILSWQTASGCFTYDEISCSSHMNGLGAASLALFGRALEESQIF